jgi:glutaryl-CoA dehydrogenase
VDYLDFDSLLTEEQRLVRDTVGSWVDDKVLPIIEEAAWEGRFPKELVPEMAQMHLFGSTIAEYGLPGLDNISYGLIMQELERGDSGLRSFVSVQSGLVMYPIYTFGSKEQKDKWIPKLASAQALGCFGLTEPDFGSNPAGMRTTAKKDGDSYVLNGARRGSPAAPSPTSQSSGPSSTASCADSWSSAGRRASRPSSTRARCRYARR